MSVETIKEIVQYLSFELGDEVFALDISKVREVLDYKKVTKVPKTPEFMIGVINLRGGAVPLVDMRLKLGMEQIQQTINTCVIIVEAALDGEPVVIGALADSVREVFDMDAEDIEPAPAIGTHLKTEFLKGMDKRQSGIVLLLDIDRVFSPGEIATVCAGEAEAVSNNVPPDES
jgi:purine-binding chemotaxis protein CheW